MGSSNSKYFGFELLYKSIENDLKKKEDVIVAFTHWILLTNGFKCIGLGDSKKIDPDEKTSELLPKGWNEKDHFTLRYLKDSKLYILIARKSDENLMLNLLGVGENNVSNVKFDVEATVKSLDGELLSMIPSSSDVIFKITKELLEPVDLNNSKHSATQTSAEEEKASCATRPVAQEERDFPLRIGGPRFPNRPEDPVLYVGAADLDPLVGLGVRPIGRGGGMLYDPFENRGVRGERGDPLRPEGIAPRLPRGAIPPGARFDPIGPPDIAPGRFPPRNPDHDHMQPPGYDDMFM